MNDQRQPRRVRAVPYLIKCGGVNPRTRQKVGERHRWEAGYGIGFCKWCGRSMDQLRVKPVKEAKP